MMFLKQAIDSAKKERNATKLFYYQECAEKNYSACVSFETFRGSWAYEGWLKLKQPAITMFVLTENKRFPTMKWKIE